MFYKLQALVYRELFLSEFNLLTELSEFINFLPDWPEKSSQWFMATSSGGLLAIDNGIITKQAIDYVRRLIVSKDDVILVLADKNKDDSILTITFNNASVVSKERYLLSLTVSSLSFDESDDVFIKIIESIVTLKNWMVRYVILDTEQYRRKERFVFDDRLPVGWMLYLPIKITNETIPSASAVIHVKNNQGTIIVSKSFFNGAEPSDVIISNNVEMELASNGLLPLTRGL